MEREVSPNPVSEPSPISESSPVFRSAPNPKFAPLSNLAARLEPLPLGPVDDERLLGSPTKPDDSVLHLYCSPNTPPPGRNGRLGSRESRSTTSTQFDLPLLDDLDDDSQSSGTLVPDEVNRETEEFELSPAAKDIIQFIYDMEVDPQASSADRRKQKRILQIAVSTWEDDFQKLDPSKVPLNELKEAVTRAKNFKDEILQAQIDSEIYDDLQDLRTKAGTARSGFISFVNLAFEEMRKLEDKIPEPTPPSSLNVSNVSGSSASAATRAKVLRVEKYAEPTIGKLQELIDKLVDLTLESPETQQGFQTLQDRAKNAYREVDAVKKKAKEIINQALDCDLGDKSSQIEDLLWDLETKEDVLVETIQSHKDEYGISSGFKPTDMKFPTFSGEQTEKYDYYTYVEDWEAWVAMRSVSKVDQLRILLRQSLVGQARAACRHMTTLDEVFSHLKECYGNASDLFVYRVDEIRRLGACVGSNEKKRKWSVEVRSQLVFLRNLSQKHDMYENLYHHPIVSEILEGFPPDILDKFYEETETISARIPKKRVFEMVLEHLDRMVVRFNNKHTLQLDHGVDPDKYYKKKMENKKSAPGSSSASKPPPKIKSYASAPASPPSASPPSASASTSASGPSSASAKPKKPQNKRGGVFISPAYSAPAMKPCKVCNGQHTHVFYCKNFIDADILTDRVDVAKKMQSCYRCLRMDAEIDFGARAQWEKRHEAHCQSEFVCTLGKCAHRAKNRQYHITLCRWHAEENKLVQDDFLKKLDPAQLPPGTSFFFNLANSYFINPSNNTTSAMTSSASLSKRKPRDDVNNPAIFMLQNHVVNDRNLLIFYDSGCMGSAISDEAAQILSSVCVRPGPTTLNVAAGKTVRLEGGDEQFLLDLAEPGDRATITALRMPHVTTKFPAWPIADAWKSIQAEYKQITSDKKPLSPAPKTIGGDEVGIMIGIRYLQYFPIPILTLPCGLGIHKSQIAAPRGELTVLGGPHPAWRNATDLVGFLGVTSFFTAELQALRCISQTLHHVHHPVEHVPDEPDLDAIDNDLLVPEGEIFETCPGNHCDKHGDLENWIIPVNWDIESSAFGLRQEVSRFCEAEILGTEVPYRCVRCRNCARCRQGETLENASLKEEQEQYLIDLSVSFNPEKKKLVAKLPFAAPPGVHLKPNRYTAEKILDSQIRNLAKDDHARADVLASHEKLRSRGYVLPLSELPLEEQALVLEALDSGYIIPWRAVWNSSSISTPCRMVFDASSKTPGGESLNNILAKGTNYLPKIPNSIQRFRAKPGGVTCDVSMAYNQVELDPSHYRYQQYLWKPDLDPSHPVVVMVVRTLIYGVKSAGNQLFSGFESVADYCLENYPEHSIGAIALKQDGYVDDIVHAAESREAAISTANSLDFVLQSASLAVKSYTFAGSPPSDAVSKDGVHVGLLGMVWDPAQDLIGVDIKDLYFGKTKRGVLPVLVSGDIRDALRQNFTRRNLLGKVAGIYDPIGLVTPITSRLKLDLHDLCLEKLDWDDKVPDSYLEKWLVNLQDIQGLKEIRFRRTVIPPDAASLDLSLIVSSDASKSIAVASVHTRVLLTSGSYYCQLLTAKSKIVRYDTIPRGELRAAVMSSSLAHTVKFNLQSQYSDSIYVTDSTIVLHWLNHDERPLETAVRNSVIEIRRLSDLKNWFHIDGNLNLADLGTRHTEVFEIGLDSEWQNGKAWMSLPRDEMPLKTIGEINLSSEEKRVASQETKTQVLFNDLPEMIPRVSERYEFSKYIFNPGKRSWESSVRVVSYVLRFISSFKRKFKPPWYPPPSPMPPTSTEYPFILLNRPHLTDEQIECGENYFFFKATKEVIKFSLEKEYKNSYVVKNEIYYYVGRILDGQEIHTPEETMLDLTPLSFVRPIVDRYSPVAYSIMLHSHEQTTHHRCSSTSLLESRSVAFILRGRDLATEVTKACRFCNRHKAKLIEVKMGQLHDSRLTIAPVFYRAQVDLFGPLTAICEHQHRSTVKVYGCVFKDPASCAVAIFVMQAYSTPAFIQAYTRFSARYGHPTELRIDEGSQLMSACKNMELSVMDISDFLSVNHRVGIKFSTCPVAGHNANGMVERSIREIKNLLNKVYSGLRLDILSMETCFSWIASELNNLPICIGSRTDNLDHIDLITPSRLLLGRNNRRALSGFPTVSSPSRLIEQMDRVYDSWWNVWRTQKLVDFIPQPSKWKKTNEQLKPGDVVIFLKSDSENRLGEPVWKIARVKEIDVSKDGLSRSATLEYRNPSEKTFRTTHRSARSVVVVHREGDLDVAQSLELAARGPTLDPG